MTQHHDPSHSDEGSDGRPLPLHLHPASLTLVFAGGTTGVAAREALTLALPTPAGGVPWVILAINLSGAFVLGILLDVLARRGPDHGRRRTLRLLLGTGVIGGYTTHSALATDTALLIGGGSAGVGIGYGLSTVLVGGIATWSGIAIATLAHRPRTEETS